MVVPLWATTGRESLLSNRKVQEPSVTVPLAALPPESNVTGPTLVPQSCQIAGKCLPSASSTYSKIWTSSARKCEGPIGQILAVAGTPMYYSYYCHPRTVCPNDHQAIHCAMRRAEQSAKQCGSFISPPLCVMLLASCTTLQSSCNDVKKGRR